MKDMGKLMSCWTLKLLEIIIVLFYLKHIMLERYFKYLSMHFVICLCLHHMIRKYTWKRIMVIVFLQENMYKSIIA
jgi:hypothetical protein